MRQVVAVGDAALVADVGGGDDRTIGVRAPDSIRSWAMSHIGAIRRVWRNGEMSGAEVAPVSATMNDDPTDRDESQCAPRDDCARNAEHRCNRSKENGMDENTTENHCYTARGGLHLSMLSRCHSAAAVVVECWVFVPPSVSVR